MYICSVPSDGPTTIYRAAKVATPLFAKDSPVFDSHTGALHYAGSAVEEHGYVFVMYYASWSARSLLAKEQFEAAAHVMKGRVSRLHSELLLYVMLCAYWSVISFIWGDLWLLQVPFVAIQCWYQSSQCKSKYKFYSFPAFYVYASGMDMGFAYTG